MSLRGIYWASSESADLICYAERGIDQLKTKKQNKVRSRTGEVAYIAGILQAVATTNMGLSWAQAITNRTKNAISFSEQALTS